MGGFARQWSDCGSHLFLVRREIVVLAVGELVGHIVILVLVDALSNLPATQDGIQNSGTALVRWLQQLLHCLFDFRDDVGAVQLSHFHICCFLLGLAAVTCVTGLSSCSHWPLLGNRNQIVSLNSRVFELTLG